MGFFIFSDRNVGSADETPARYSSSTRCRGARYVFRCIFPENGIYFSGEKIGSRVYFDLLRDAIRPAVDRSLPLGPELAEFKHTRQIFKPNFLGNGRSVGRNVLLPFRFVFARRTARE